MKLLKINLLFSFIFLTFLSVQAQKFGHINTGNLLVALPETKVADEKLKVFQDSLIAIGEEMAKKLEAEFLAFSKDYQEGNLTPMAAQKKQGELQQKRDQLADYEEKVMNLVADRREVLLAPILDKVQDAINQVGKEGGYTMIFDVSVYNSILFAQESDNLEALVKAKLGIK